MHLEEHEELKKRNRFVHLNISFLYVHEV